MRGSMFPEIHFVMHRTRGAYKACGIGEAILIPDECAGIRMSLPTAFEPDHITRNLVITKLLSQRRRTLLCCARLRPIPKPQSPLRRNHAATGEDVVAPDRIQHLWTGKQIYVHAT